MTSITAHSTLAEIDAAIELGDATVADARKILTERAKRDSASGRRAAAWLKAHKATPKAKAQAKPVAKPAKPTNFRTVFATACMKNLHPDMPKGAPGWRTQFFAYYRSEQAHAYEARCLAGEVVPAGK